MFYHWTIFALDAEERVALSSPAYETGILLLNYSAMVEIDGPEPPTFELSYMVGLLRIELRLWD